MKNKVKNSGNRAERKIDMAEHGYRLKSIGLPERVVKKMIRIVILLVPLALVIFWFIEAVK